MKTSKPRTGTKPKDLHYSKYAQKAKDFAKTIQNQKRVLEKIEKLHTPENVNDLCPQCHEYGICQTRKIIQILGVTE